MPYGARPESIMVADSGVGALGAVRLAVVDLQDAGPARSRGPQPVHVMFLTQPDPSVEVVISDGSVFMSAGYPAHRWRPAQPVQTFRGIFDRMIRLVRALTSDPLLAETAPPGPRRLHQITEVFVRARHHHLLDWCVSSQREAAMEDGQRHRRDRADRQGSPRAPRMRAGLPVRWALAALVTLAIVASLGVELAGSGGSGLPVPRQGFPACQVGCRYVGVALAHMGEAPLRTFERLSGVKPQIEENYWAFGEPFPSGWARTLLRQGILPLIQINPRRESPAAITAGRYDSYLRRFAAEVRALGAPVALSFAHEMNGSWYPWGFKHVQPGVFVAAWRHVHYVLGAAGARRVIWVWTVAHTAPQAGRLFAPVRPYWPGAAYVNWVGLDIYYSNPRTMFRTAFVPTIAAVRRFTREPILLTETAVPNQYDQLQQISNLFAGARAARLLGVIWYDQDARMSWELNNRPAAVAAFRRDAQRFRQAGRGAHAST